MKSNSLEFATEIQKWYILERAPYLHMHTSIVQTYRHLHMLVRLYEDQSNKADLTRVGGKTLWFILCELHCHCQTVWILFTSTTLCTQKRETKVKCRFHLNYCLRDLTELLLIHLLISGTSCLLKWWRCCLSLAWRQATTKSPRQLVDNISCSVMLAQCGV